jgi:hypothetical protein
MRYLAITPFEQAIEIPDFEHLIRTRLSQAIVIWPEQALLLIGYMGWLNDPQARAEAIRDRARLANGLQMHAAATTTD